MIFKIFVCRCMEVKRTINTIRSLTARMTPYLNMILLAAIVIRKSCIKSFKVVSHNCLLDDTTIIETTIMFCITV